MMKKENRYLGYIRVKQPRLTTTGCLYESLPPGKDGRHALHSLSQAHKYGTASRELRKSGSDFRGTDSAQ